MDVSELYQLFQDCRQGSRNGSFAHHELEPFNPPADPAHIALAEQQLGATFTEELTNLYLAIDGGRPIPAFYEFSTVDPALELERAVEEHGRGSRLVQSTRRAREHVSEIEGIEDAAYPIDFDYIQLSSNSEVTVLYQLSGANRGAVIYVNYFRRALSTLLAPSLDNLLLAVRDCYVQFGEFSYIPESEDIRRRYQISDPPPH